MKKNILIPLLAILLSGAILLGLSLGLASVAEKKAEENLLWHMQTLLPGSGEFTEEAYSGEDANIRSVHKAENGYVIETAVQGYAGEITMLIGVRNSGKVTGLVVTKLSETFGLGAEALSDHVFLAQFLNTNGNVSIGTSGADAFSGATGEETSTEDTLYVDGITGATVTSKAIARSVNSAVAYVTGADADSGATSWGG
ncbi:MAG: FMN-binding protein [Oscillospiraceae bacterium]|jgi:electron transport complex protein RnfG|nr:FMN-binding protein [Oscillospiraceae bacterium]